MRFFLLVVLSRVRAWRGVVFGGWWSVRRRPATTQTSTTLNEKGKEQKKTYTGGIRGRRALSGTSRAAGSRRWRRHDLLIDVALACPQQTAMAIDGPWELELTDGLLGGALFGFDISSMSGVLGTQAYMRFFDRPKSTRQGGITCAMPAGSIVGALASSFIADKFSRKVAIQVSAVIWIIGSMSAFSPCCAMVALVDLVTDVVAVCKRARTTSSN